MHDRALHPSQSGELRGPVSLLPAAWVYSAIIRLRNTLYDHGWLLAHRAGIPIVSVGNLTVGGTGKTPHVIELVRRLAARGERPAILTRGYRGTAHRPADEVLELRAALPEAAVIVHADRVRGAAEALSVHATCAIMDDGFQHRRLHRDLDIVLIDALRPWGGGALLPAGRLREPPGSLRRADLVIITRTNQVDSEWAAQIIRTVRAIAPNAAVVTSHVRVSGIIDENGQPATIPAAENHRFLLVAGLGNVETVIHSAREFLGESRIAQVRRFPDHHCYAAQDVASIIRETMHVDAAGVLTTRKDWVKLAPLWPAKGEAPRLLRLEVGVTINDPEGIVDRLLARTMESRS